VVNALHPGRLHRPIQALIKERNAMEIRQSRVMIRTANFERAMKFYAGALALPQIQSWNRETERGAVFQAGSALIEILGPPAGEDVRLNDERFNSQGPRLQVMIVLEVASAEQARQDIFSRDKSVAGPMTKDDQGRLCFVTSDPDHLRIVFREG
jgi:predicted enzyme related to lactoylglutathione lyase